MNDATDILRWREHIGIFLVLLLIFPGISPAQYWGNQGMQIYSETLVKGDMDALVGVDAQLSGDTLYVTDMYGLRIYDVSTVTAPVEVSRVGTPGFATRFRLTDSLAFIADWTGLTIVDIQDIYHPELVNYVEIDSGAYGIELKDHYAYVSSNSELWVFDVSNPAAVTPVYQWTLPASGNIDLTSLMRYGNTLYLTTGLHLYVLDISNPAQPVLTFSMAYNSGGTCWGNMAISGNYLYVVTTLALFVYDISNPNQPVVVYNTLPAGSSSIYDIALRGNYMILNHWQGVWKIYDVSNPVSPTLVYASGGGNSNPFYWHYSLGAFTDPYMFFLDRGQPNGNGWTVHIWDMTNITNPMEISSFQTISGVSKSTHILERDGHTYALVAQGNSRNNAFGGFLRIVDVTNPSQPDLISTVEIPNEAFCVVAGGNYAVVRGYEISWPNWVHHLYLVDITDLNHPLIINQATIAAGQRFDQLNSMVMIGDTLFIADINRLTIMRVTGGAFQTLGTVSILGGASESLRMQGTEWAYVAGLTQGVQIYNVANPSGGFMYNWYDTPGSAFDVYLHNGYVYVADFTGIVVLRDMNHILMPVTTIPTASSVWYITGENNLIFVTRGDRTIEVFDITDPEQPVSLGTYNTSGVPRQMRVSHYGSRVYVSDHLDLGIYRPLFNYNPLPFSLIAPANDTTLSSQSIDFLWERSIDANGDSLMYSLHLWESQWDTTLNTSDTMLSVPASLFPGDGTYHWTVEVTDGAFTRTAEDTFQFALVTTGVDPDEYDLPERFALEANYPNPFNPTTTLRYRVPRTARVKIEVFNNLGQKVRTLVNGPHAPGIYAAVWDGTGDEGTAMASGVYVARMTAETLSQPVERFEDSRKMLLLK
ncbi:MAG: T9SS C-terminal target domain-containing protein [Calditrichaeota bacterium]|nr:MAG: T9SS C-terminal target domain-containing protein [Calditrichota bacterium]